MGFEWTVALRILREGGMQTLMITTVRLALTSPELD